MPKNPTINKATVYKADGTSYELLDRPTLKDAQQIVGGYIEFVPKDYHIKKGLMIICNEEGIINNLPYNLNSAKFFNPPFGCHGDFIVLEGWKTVGVDK